MTELVLTDLDELLLDHLCARAARHGQTPADEAKAILTEALAREARDSWATVDAIYGRMAASGRTFSDSGELLREDRDR